MAQLSNTVLASDANLQGYWQLEDVTDSGPNSYNLTNVNSATFPAGKFNNAVLASTTGPKYLTATDGSVPNLEISGSQSWTGWIRSNTETPEGNMVAKANGANTHDIFISGARPFFRLAGLTTNTSVQSSQSVSQNVWYHIVGVYDSSTSKLKIYVNNVKTEVTASGSAVDTNGSFEIGASTAGGNAFDGLIDDIAIFDRALTDSEVALLFNPFVPSSRSFGIIIG